MHRFLPALLSLLILVWAGSAQARWDYGARANLNAGYNSNPILRDDDNNPEDLARVLAVFQMDMENRTDNSTFTFQPRVTRDWYPDETRKALESTDIFLPGSASYTTSRTNSSLGFNVQRQNVLSNENTIGENPDSPNTFRADDIQYTASILPSFTWSATPRDQIILQANATLLDFDLDYTGRSDFTFIDLSTSYRRAVTPRQQLGITIAAGRSEIEGLACREDPLNNPPSPQEPPCAGSGNFGPIINAVNLNETDTTRFTVDYEFNWTESISITGRIGRQVNTTTQQLRDLNGATLLFDENLNPTEQLETEVENLTYDLIIRRETPRLFLEFAGQRSARPSQIGTPQDRNQLRFDSRYEFSRRIRARLNLLAWEQKSILAADNPNAQTIRFFSARVRLDYPVTRNWTVITSYAYRYRDQNRGQAGTSLRGTDNELRLGIGYTFKRLQR